MSGHPKKGILRSLDYFFQSYNLITLNLWITAKMYIEETIQILHTKTLIYYNLRRIQDKTIPT